MDISYWESLTEDEQAVLVESALARSQCAVQLAIDGAGITQTELARRLTLEQGNISLRLSGRHGMSVRTLAKTVLACGYDLRFEIVPLAKKEAK